MSIIAKLCRMLTYCERLPTLTLHGPLITWSTWGHVAFDAEWKKDQEREIREPKLDSCVYRAHQKTIIFKGAHHN